MKCKICGERMEQGKGYYSTPEGPVCTQCYCYSGSVVQMADTRAQSQKNPSVSEYGLVWGLEKVVARSFS
ncbi:MAG: hypothetical protein IMF11_12875 [Proteobacteria bacterium]|nr:hypothetical protein [Pseudomonadota bacterium]